MSDTTKRDELARALLALKHAENGFWPHAEYAADLILSLVGGAQAADKLTLAQELEQAPTGPDGKILEGCSPSITYTPEFFNEQLRKAEQRGFERAKAAAVNALKAHTGMRCCIATVEALTPEATHA